MEKNVQNYINGTENDILQSFDTAYKRRRMSKKGKRSKKNSALFTVSLKSHKRKHTTVNSQVQKRLESLLQKRGKLSESQQEGGIIGSILAATAPLWLPLAVKGVKIYFIKMAKEFVLIERREYNRLKDNPTSSVPSENEIESNTAPGTSMLSTNHLLSTVKNRVGIMYHNKVDQLFQFLKSHPSILTWTDFGETIVNGSHLPSTNVHEMLDYLFDNWQKFSKQSPPQGLDKLIPALFQNIFDPQNVVNRRLKVFSHVNEVCKRLSLIKKKQRTTHRQDIKWAIY